MDPASFWREHAIYRESTVEAGPRYQNLSWRDFRWARIQQLCVERWRLLRLLGAASRGSVVILCLAVVVRTIAAPIAAVFAGQLVRVMTTSAPTSALIWTAAAFAGAMLLRQVAETTATALNLGVSRQVDGSIRSQVRRVALRPRGIGHLEDPTFHDTAVRAGDQGITWRVRSPGAASVGQVEVTVRTLEAMAMAAVLAVHFLWLAVLLIALSLTIRLITRRQWMFLEEVKDAATPQRRKVDYWAELAAGPDAAKEVRLFGLADWLTARRLAAHRAWMADYWAIRRRVLRSQKTTIVLALASAALALTVPGTAALNGEIGLPELASCLVAAWGIFAIAGIALESFDIDYGRTAVEALRTLDATQPPAGDGGADLSGATVPEVRFEGVSFTYPGATFPVLESVDLTIRPGERLAIVGISGAGKTTLVKLLAGLYEPSRGRILIDGIDLRTLDAGRWRNRLTALFQDFIHYPLTARDNVTLAAPEPGTAGPTTDAEVAALARRGGADAVLRKLTSGLDTPLWRTGTGGRDLSGGEWQKLGIIRILYAVAHGRQVVVLDEPTAHLDVRAEAAFHEQVIGAVGSASVVLISHRLSTVRPADRIVLLKDGRIVEEGTHDQLVTRDGEYARLFRLQAARFVENKEAG